MPAFTLHPFLVTSSEDKRVSDQYSNVNLHVKTFYSLACGSNYIFFIVTYAATKFRLIKYIYSVAVLTTVITVYGDVLIAF
jgi:hypothetical protein